MEGNEFANGLLGHRVEGYLAATMGKGLVQGIWIGVYQDTESQLDRIVDDNGDILLITATRVIRPQKEVVKPYSLETKEEVDRLKSEVLGGAGFVDFYAKYDTSDGHCEWLIATTPNGKSRVKFDDTGVYMVHSNGEPCSENRIPLNDWVRASLACKDSARIFMDGYTLGQENERLKQKPAEPYSIDTLEYCQRLVDEVMIPAGFASFYGEKGGYMTACKGEHRVFIDNEGVRLVHHGEQSYPDLPFIPLNEWVKNPTIESLKPKD